MPSGRRGDGGIAGSFDDIQIVADTALKRVGGAAAAPQRIVATEAEESIDAGCTDELIVEGTKGDEQRVELISVIPLSTGATIHRYRPVKLQS